MNQKNSSFNRLPPHMQQVVEIVSVILKRLSKTRLDKRANKKLIITVPDSCKEKQ